MFKRRLLRLAIAILAAAGLPAWSQSFVSQATKVVVPNPPGGPLDVVARILAPHLATQLRQPVIVDNKSGAAGGIGVDAVAKAAPDGYTLLFTTSASLTVNPHTTKTLPYDPLTDFTPLSTVVEYSSVLVVNPQVPVNTVAELVSYAKENPRKVTYSSGGVGSMSHIEGEMLRRMTGAPMLHVPYKGNAPAMTAVISGEVTFIFNATGFATNSISSGKVRPLAVSSVVRNKMFPELPTMLEAGIPGFDVVLWYGFLGPARLPEPIASRFMQALKVVMSDSAVKEKLQGFDIKLMTPEDFSRRIKTEHSSWGKVMREVNIEKN